MYGENRRRDGIKERGNEIAWWEKTEGMKEGWMEEGRRKGEGGLEEEKNYWLFEENKPRPRRAKLPLPFKAKMFFSVCFTVNTLK